MRDLFEPISRDERQAQSVQKWLNAKGRGTLECCTGFVKLTIINLYLSNILYILYIKCTRYEKRN